MMKLKLCNIYRQKLNLSQKHKLLTQNCEGRICGKDNVFENDCRLESNTLIQEPQYIMALG